MASTNPLAPIVIDLLNLALALKMIQLRQGGRLAQNIVNGYDTITGEALRALKKEMSPIKNAAPAKGEAEG